MPFRRRYNNQHKSAIAEHPPREASDDANLSAPIAIAFAMLLAAPTFAAHAKRPVVYRH
jgi:hypothetical protein